MIGVLKSENIRWVVRPAYIIKMKGASKGFRGGLYDGNEFLQWDIKQKGCKGIY